MRTDVVVLAEQRDEGASVSKGISEFDGGEVVDVGTGAVLGSSALFRG